MIPEKLIYRIYGDTLAVIMDIKANRIVLLRNEPLRLWKALLKKDHITSFDLSNPGLQRLAGLGLVGQSLLTDPLYVSVETENRDIPALDFNVMTLWAFKNRIPISGHFELTNRCNLRCRHCYCVFDKTDDSLTTEAIFRILADLRNNGTLGLVLTGGEIFMRRDIAEILHYLQENKFVVRLNTNGTLIDEYTMKWFGLLSNVYRIHISLYSAEPVVHDRITGMSGSYYKTLRTLHLLKEAGFNLRINCCLMKSNFAGYKKVKEEIGDRLGIPVRFDPVIFPRDDGRDDNLAEAFDEGQMKEYDASKAAEYALRRGQLTPERKTKLCKAGFSFFSICEDGRLYPCLKMKRYYRNPLGNLAETSLESVWHESEPVKKIRDSMMNKLRDCDICDLEV